MAVSWSFFDDHVRTNVVEIRFKRRIPKIGWSKSRRMLCTRSKELLDSDWGKTYQQYIRPTGKLPYVPREKNLVIVYDFMRVDWRAVPCESCQIITTIPVKTDEQLQQFHGYWFDFIKQLVVTGKYQNAVKAWMDS